MTRLPTLRRIFVATFVIATATTAAATSPAQAIMPSHHQFFDSGPQAALEVAIRAHDRAAFQRAIVAGANVNATGKLAVTPLMIAVDVQDLEAVKALLGAGALANAKAADGNGPMSLAAKSYRAEPDGRAILAAVVHGGGDPDTRQRDGDPVIMQMILAHDAAGLKLMKSLGAHLDVLDRGGDPLICNVAMSADWDMVWALLELGARYDYGHPQVRAPLSTALRLPYPAPDSPLYAYKRKVWQFLVDKGIELPPLPQ